MNKILDGFCYSYIATDGVEKLFMTAFGHSRNIARQRLKKENFQRLEPLKVHKRYKVQLLVSEES